MRKYNVQMVKISSHKIFFVIMLIVNDFYFNFRGKYCEKMRFEIKLSVNKAKRGSVLPMNYQYELSSWIYKVLNEGDLLFASWLHDHGYKALNKPFKLFTFSNFFIPDYRITGDRLEIKSDNINLILSFLPDEAITHFITGLFRERHFMIGDKKSQVAFEITQVSALKNPEFDEKMVFRTISPIFVSVLDLIKGGQIYISPESDKYSEQIHQNLQDKYEAFNNRKPDPEWPKTQIRLLSKPKSKLIVIKAGTPEMSRLKAYNFTFEISGSRELIGTGYWGGFGKLGSQGFGCVEM